ncbi:MAG TPA: GntR family transcriptional regulator [Limnobacter sp.]|uniref:GntR family transcriptional regulator n=1 Tax=Limnobacter sp. TaxID=2003368 RepID=UPI002EDB3F01
MSKLSDELRERIEQDIATGVLGPGTHLDEAELAERFEVSRTPIREAISMLAGEGLVEIRPRRGAVVVQITPQRLFEMFEVMAELEAMCARLAARRINDKELAQLQEAHDACRKAAASTDTDAYFYANENFHRLIYTCSRNTFLTEEAAALQRKLRPYRRLQLRVKNRLQKSFDEHQSVLDALAAHEEQKAATLLRNHVLVQGERFADLLASLAQMETQ